MGLLKPLLLPPESQDKGQVLSDVRSIIAEQLGTDLDKVRRGRLRLLPPQPEAAAVPWLLALLALRADWGQKG